MKFLKFWLSLLLLHQVTASFARNSSTLQPPLERMLSRKKRFVIMPKGTNLKFTLQLSKALLSRFPRGFNFNMEAAFYYPTPGSRLDLIPKRLRKPTTTTPKPFGTKPPIFVCIPGSLICYKAKPVAKPAKVQRIDENGNELQWIEAKQPMNYESYQQYGQKYGEKYSQKYGEKYDEKYGEKYDEKYGQKYGQKYGEKYGEPQQYEKYKWHSKSHPKWTTYTPPHQYIQSWPQMQNITTYTRWSQPRLQHFQTQHRQQRWRRTLTRFQPYLLSSRNEELHSYDPIDFPDLVEHYDWQHYHSHRDRRQLFHQFEGLSQILGFDLKACVVRAICESKRYLLPPGYSMIQDILRVVFTLPTVSGLTDDYSHAMRADYETCDKFLRPKCAFNILNWFLAPKQGPQII